MPISFPPPLPLRYLRFNKTSVKEIGVRDFLMVGFLPNSLIHGNVETSMFIN
jgi:hypothetical protein